MKIDLKPNRIGSQINPDIYRYQILMGYSSCVAQELNNSAGGAVIFQARNFDWKIEREVTKRKGTLFHDRKVVNNLIFDEMEINLDSTFLMVYKTVSFF